MSAVKVKGVCWNRMDEDVAGGVTVSQVQEIPINREARRSYLERG